MPTSGRGNDAATCRRILRRPCAPRGFTLIELLVVLAVLAVGIAVASLALRDPDATRLERDAERLAALFEIARAEARASGIAAAWVPARADDPRRFRFVGLRAASRMPEHWLDGEVRAQVIGAPSLVLGPDAILPPQRVVLSLGARSVAVASDGLAAFAVQPAEALP